MTSISTSTLFQAGGGDGAGVYANEIADSGAAGRDVLRAQTLAILKDYLSLQSADIKDSGPLGRALMAAVNQPAAISILGLSSTPEVQIAQLAASLASLSAQKGSINGLAPLDSSARIPSAYLPAYVDDVLEFATLASFPTSGEVGKIYITLDTNLEYRWSGSQYTKIAAGDVNSVAGLVGVVTASALKSALSLVIGTDVQAALGYTPVNPVNLLAENIDLNTVLTSGFYRLPGGISNAPHAAAAYSQMIVSRGEDTISQEITAYGGAYQWFRAASGLGATPVWSPWRASWHSGNFDPATKFNAAGGSISGDTNIYRSAYPTSGLVSFGADALSYLYFDGGAFTFNKTLVVPTLNASMAMNSPVFNSTVQSNFMGNQQGSIAQASTVGYGTGGLMVQGPGNPGGAYMSFHRPGNFAACFGLDIDNKWKFGGWSMGANAYEIYHAGNPPPQTSISARITGSTGAILASSGIASVSRVSAGVYTVTMSTARASVNYAVPCNSRSATGNQVMFVNESHSSQFTRTTMEFQIRVFDVSGNLADPQELSLTVTGG